VAPDGTVDWLRSLVRDAPKRPGRAVSPCAYGRASSDAVTSSRCVSGAERMSVTTGAFWMWG
jgi:hypothetical protein